MAEAHFAHLLFHLLDPAQFDGGGAARGGFVQSRAHLGVGRERKIRVDLFGEVALRALLLKKIPSQGRE